MTDKVKSINYDQFQKLVLEDISDNLILLDIWAIWCPPCNSFAPIFEKFAVNHPTTICYKLNIEENSQITTKLKINSIPTLLLFRTGKCLHQQAGLLVENELSTLVSQYLLS